MQFYKDRIACLQQILEEMKDLEVTQEIKLSEEQGNIDHILGAWGQILIRSKEWDNGAISISGGIMTWVMYAEEEDQKTVTLENWMPFECQWEIPKEHRDGNICVSALLRMMDARSISARKIMVRAGISVSVKAMTPCEKEVYRAQDLPDHVQLNVLESNLTIPSECGEKSFSLDEELQLPDSAERLMRYQMIPYITETKVMAEKLVFRGGALLCGLYEKGDRLHSFSLDVPYAQYTSLDREYDPDAVAFLYPLVTGLELELMDEGRLRLKAGIVSQYVICDRQNVVTISDVYSNEYDLQVQMGTLSIQSVSPMEMMTFPVKTNVHSEGELVDHVFLQDHPRTCRLPEGMDIQLSGKYYTLFYNMDGSVQSGNGKWEDSVCVKCDENEHLYLQLLQEDVSIDQQMILQFSRVKNINIPVVETISLEEKKTKDENRPSVIIRKVGDDSLWEIAKQTGSTVTDICRTNQLQGQPDPHQILLIPVV